MFLRKKEKSDIIALFTRRSTVLSLSDRKSGLDFLVSFFSAVRPTSGANQSSAESNLDKLIASFDQYPILLTNLQHALLSQLISTDLSAALTESGIPLARGFWQEFFGRLRHKLLPPLQNETDFLYTINHIFYRKKDYQWVESIPILTWALLFEKLSLSIHVDDRRISDQLLHSLKILSFQVSQLGFEREVYAYISAEFLEINPFLQQNYLIHELEDLVLQSASPDQLKPLVEQINKVLGDCHRSISEVQENHRTQGVSLHQTYTLIILVSKLDRMAILIDVLDFFLILIQLLYLLIRCTIIAHRAYIPK